MASCACTAVASTAVDTSKLKTYTLEEASLAACISFLLRTRAKLKLNMVEWQVLQRTSVSRLSVHDTSKLKTNTLAEVSVAERISFADDTSKTQDAHD